MNLCLECSKSDKELMSILRGNFADSDIEVYEKNGFSGSSDIIVIIIALAQLTTDIIVLLKSNNSKLKEKRFILIPGNNGIKLDIQNYEADDLIKILREVGIKNDHE